MTGWRWKLLVLLFWIWWAVASITSEVAYGWNRAKAWPPKWKDLF